MEGLAVIRSSAVRLARNRHDLFVAESPLSHPPLAVEGAIFPE